VKNQRLMNITLYAVLLALGLAGLARSDTTTAVVGLGLSLAFDPFDPNLAFPQRPLWQRSILTVQVVVVIGVIARELWSRFG
jgi:hypothetical protein